MPFAMEKPAGAALFDAVDVFKVGLPVFP